MGKLMSSLKSRGRTIGELFAYLWENKLWWIIPAVAVIILFGFFYVRRNYRVA